MHCQQREAALAAARQAAVGEQRAVVAEAQLDMAETEVDRLEDLVMSNNAAADRQVARLNALWNRVSNDDQQQLQRLREDARRCIAEVEAELAQAEEQARQAERRARQANRRANEQAWDAVRARAAAAAAVSLLGPVDLVD